MALAFFGINVKQPFCCITTRFGLIGLISSTRRVFYWSFLACECQRVSARAEKVRNQKKIPLRVWFWVCIFGVSVYECACECTYLCSYKILVLICDIASAYYTFICYLLVPVCVWNRNLDLIIDDRITITYYRLLFLYFNI